MQETSYVRLQTGASTQAALPDVKLTLCINPGLYADLAREAAISEMTPQRFISELAECAMAERRLAALTADLSDDDLRTRNRQVKPEGYRKTLCLSRPR